MALPSIVLLLAFVGGASAGTGLLFHDSSSAWVLVASSATGIVAAWVHWRRFRVPITVAAGAASVLVLTVTLMAAAQPDREGWLSPFSFVAGLCVFWLALRWDMADRLRRTRRADVAFWLHLLAAPLLVNPVFLGLKTLSPDHVSWERTLAVLLLYVALALVSLAIDRRALMVSALAYVLFALNEVLRQQAPAQIGFASTALVLGGGLLVLSARWQRCRSAVLARLPPAWRAKLPPLG